MPLRWQDWNPQVLAALRKGVVIPAHPLALDADRKLDARRQRALTRYYLDSGAGGLAVGVHTTQFAIREAGLFEPVLALALRSAAQWSRRPVIMIAGLVGRTAQAVNEARLSRRAPVARRTERRGRGRAHRPCAEGRARVSARRLLPAAGRGRARAAGVVLAP